MMGQRLRGHQVMRLSLLLRRRGVDSGYLRVIEF